MTSDPQHDVMHRYYELGKEAVRLSSSGAGRLEFERTQEIVLRHLPEPPATVADIGGGPGRYALWLARLGYHVVHRDVVPLHVDQVRTAAAARGLPGVGCRRRGDRSCDLVPPLALLFGWAFLGEVPPALVFPGGVLCLAGVALARTRAGGLSPSNS